jgi:hypothetical protein
LDAKVNDLENSVDLLKSEIQTYIVKTNELEEENRLLENKMEKRILLF